MSWRARARRIIAACFDWQADVLPSGIVRVTARGATAGFGETQEVAAVTAVEATLRDLEAHVRRAHAATGGDAVLGRLSAKSTLDGVRMAAFKSVYQHEGPRWGR